MLHSLERTVYTFEETTEKGGEKEKNMTNILNLTPHSISFIGDDGNIISVIDPSGQLARVSARTVRTGEISGIPTSETEYGEVESLPDPQDGVIYIVSSLVASRCQDRDDVFIPNESVRDSQGRIIGCKSLGRV